ncbi:MAG: phosphoglycerate transporter, partial [Aeromicrobium sp.]|nr:phosphoglycerate transporter [Aeromicrobium sp.]
NPNPQISNYFWDTPLVRAELLLPLAPGQQDPARHERDACGVGREQDAADHTEADHEPLGHEQSLDRSYASGVTDFGGIVDAIDGLRAESPRVVVAITGHGGAGKSTLSRALVDRIPHSIHLHGDDFLDPERIRRRSTDWDGVGRLRMRAEVLDPFRQGDPVSYRPYDWDAQELRSAVTLPRGDVLIVDSIAILHPELDGCFDLSVWIDVDLETAGARAVQRDLAGGHDYVHLWAEVWTPNDRDFAATFDPASSADLRFLPG